MRQTINRIVSHKSVYSAYLDQKLNYEDSNKKSPCFPTGALKLLIISDET